MKEFGFVELLGDSGNNHVKLCKAKIWKLKVYNVVSGV